MFSVGNTSILSVATGQAGVEGYPIFVNLRRITASTQTSVTFGAGIGIANTANSNNDTRIVPLQIIGITVY